MVNILTETRQFSRIVWMEDDFQFNFPWYKCGSVLRGRSTRTSIARPSWVIAHSTLVHFYFEYIYNTNRGDPGQWRSTRAGDVTTQSLMRGLKVWSSAVSRKIPRESRDGQMSGEEVLKTETHDDEHWHGDYKGTDTAGDQCSTCRDGESTIWHRGMCRPSLKSQKRDVTEPNKETTNDKVVNNPA